MDSLTVTVIGGVIVVVIGLFIEYGIIKRRKKDIPENLPLPSACLPNLQVTDPVSPPDIPSKTDADLPWPKAINKAVAEFHTLHKGKTIHVISTNATGRFAYLRVSVWHTSSRHDETYDLVVDKTGEITSIERFYYP